jgi:hypothetical protein
VCERFGGGHLSSKWLINDHSRANITSDCIKNRDMKLILSFLALLMFGVGTLAQDDLQRMAATEREFEAFAEKAGIKAAFIEYAAPDGVLFAPDKVNAKAYWSSRGESNALLSWAPNYADISTNGLIGYTYGNWEFRPKGKNSEPAGFGHFITVWQRQPDGKYRFVVDIGIDHDKHAKYSTELASPSIRSTDLNLKNTSAADSASGFYSKLASQGPAKAYKAFAAEEIRVFRQGKYPLVGLKALSESIKGDKGSYALAKRSSFFGSVDIAYNFNTYTKTADGKMVEKGNSMQIWKLINGRWRIVLDIFKPLT